MHRPGTRRSSARRRQSHGAPDSTPARLGPTRQPTRASRAARRWRSGRHADAVVPTLGVLRRRSIARSPRNPLVGLVAVDPLLVRARGAGAAGPDAARPSSRHARPCSRWSSVVRRTGLRHGGRHRSVARVCDSPTSTATASSSRSPRPLAGVARRAGGASRVTGGHRRRRPRLAAVSLSTPALRRGSRPAHAADVRRIAAELLVTSPRSSASTTSTPGSAVRASRRLEHGARRARAATLGRAPPSPSGGSPQSRDGYVYVHRRAVRDLVRNRASATPRLGGWTMTADRVDSGTVPATTPDHPCPGTADSVVRWTVDGVPRAGSPSALRLGPGQVVVVEFGPPTVRSPRHPPMRAARHPLVAGTGRLRRATAAAPRWRPTRACGPARSRRPESLSAAIHVSSLSCGRCAASAAASSPTVSAQDRRVGRDRLPDHLGDVVGGRRGRRARP